MPSLPAVLSGGAVLAVGGGLGGTYYFTLETFGEFLDSRRALPIVGFNEEWKALQKNLKDFTGNTNDWDKSFLDLKNGLPEGDDNKGDKLRKWCTDIRSQTLKSIFKSENTALVENALRHCVYTISMKLSSFSGTGDFETLTASLWQARESDKDLEFDKELQEIRNSSSEEIAKTKKEELKKWCQETSSKGYVGEEDDVYKVFKKYCVETRAK